MMTSSKQPVASTPAASSQKTAAQKTAASRAARGRNGAVFLWVAFLVAFLGLSDGASAQIKVKSDAVILFGSTANCSQPATIKFSKVRAKTKEWKKIKSDGISEGSARYKLLIVDMNDRIKKAAAAAAASEKCDVVVRKGDIQDKKGLTVTDLTKAVIDEL